MKSLGKAGSSDFATTKTCVMLELFNASLFRATPTEPMNKPCKIYSKKFNLKGKLGWEMDNFSLIDDVTGSIWHGTLSSLTYFAAQMAWRHAAIRFAWRSPIKDIATCCSCAVELKKIGLLFRNFWSFELARGQSSFHN